MNVSRLYSQKVLLLVFSMFVVFTYVANAASDPAIDDWGSPPGSPPPWNTADIWVDNDGDGILDEPGEPSKGILNRLFARVRNLGTTAAAETTVTFAYAPYGLWSPSSHSDFKEIDSVTVNLGAAGSADAEKTLEVQWDLSNLFEDNGGAWGTHSIQEFDHFCVLVRIEQSGDSNTGNNLAQNNFVNVATTFSSKKTIKFLLPNPFKKTVYGHISMKGLTKDWKPVFRGIESPEKFTLKPREIKLVTLEFVPVQPPSGLTSVKRNVDIDLRLNGKLAGGISFTVTAVNCQAPSGTTLAPYLIGTYDQREKAHTVLHILNPTGKFLYVTAVFFDHNEKWLKMVDEKMSPNDLWELDVRKFNVHAEFGVVKVVSWDIENRKVPDIGITGYQRHFFGERGVTESILQPIPMEILKGDLKYILNEKRAVFKKAIFKRKLLKKKVK
ncbi:MAG: hypothetical protein GY757_00915 [bacterium]|nr:hypothetical protein [bacterium]